jgi:hypothetical protein
MRSGLMKAFTSSGVSPARRNGAYDTQAIRADGASGNATGRPIAHHPYSPASASSTSTTHAHPFF